MGKLYVVPTGREFGRYDIPCYPDSERSGFDTC